MRNRLSELPHVLEQLEAMMRGTGLAADEAADLRLMAEEVLSNIVKYAFEDEREHVIEVSVRAVEHEAALAFRDDGRAFDPLADPVPEPQPTAVERPAGGLGLVLVRALADQASYRRSGGCNILALTKRLPGRAAAGRAGNREKE